MNKINIPFRGMTNVPDDSFSQDGSMSVLLNMRHRGGELVQCQPPTKDVTVQVKQALYHAQSGQWLFLKPTGQINIGGETVTGVTSFALMGNIVVLYKERSVEYAIWRNGAYVYLGPLPEVPVLTATDLDEKNKTRKTGGKYYRVYNPDKPESSSLYNRAVQKGFVDEVLNSIYEDCGYVDRAWFRVGLKLFDGSYIALSNIYQLSARETSDTDLIGVQDLWVAEDVKADTSEYTVKVNYFVPKLAIEGHLENWKDIVASIDVFSTGSIMSYVAAKERGERGGTIHTDAYEWYRPRTAEEMKEAMLNAEFFKIAEYSLDGTKTWGIDNTSPSIIAVQQHLDEIQVHEEIADKAAVYNSRLHIAEIKERFFKGFAPAYRYDGTSSTRTDAKWTIVVYIDTAYGSKRVIYQENENTTKLLHYFMYPDSRAVRMEIYRTNSGALEVAKIPLTAHRVRNEAYYLQTKISNVIQVVGETNRQYKVAVIDTALNWESATSIPTADDINVMTDILKVSAVDNPFYFPTAQTYKFEGNIEGLASNAEAISTGQFGQYPLFVFTTEGIWAMAVDASGQGAYVSQSPFSREVCSGAVCPVSGGIVFTTERGVMAISGGQVTELSAPLGGLADQMLENSDALMTAIFGKAGKNKDLPNTPVPIRVYLEGAKLAYNYLHNEVILSNVNYGYSYVYSLANQEWSMIDVVFDVTTNSYPELVVYNNGSTRRITFNDGNEANAVVAITRPVKVDTLDFKRLRQAALRCTFEGSLNFYVLGSNDGARFVCITGKEYPSLSGNEPTEVTRRDLITSMSRSKQYKYIAIAVAGNMKGRVSLTEMLVEGGFASNQLR